jgi:hypothetical protein
VEVGLRAGDEQQESVVHCPIVRRSEEVDG